MSKSYAIRIDLVENVASVVVVLFSTMTAILGFSPASFYTGDGFLGPYRNLALFFAVFFAFGDCASMAYWHYRGIKRRPMGDSRDFLIVFALIVCMGLLYSVVRFISFPYISSALSCVVGSVFGFSFGVELRLEGATAEGDEKRRTRARFDHSLKDNLVYVLLIPLFVYPLEYLGARMGFSVIMIVVTGAALIGAYVYFAERLIGLGIVRLEIGPLNSPATTLAVVAISALSMAGFMVWDRIAFTDIRFDELGAAGKLATLVFLGVVPVRLMPLLFLGSRPLTKALSALSVACYVLMKIGAFAR